jgi:hypothetical protein
MHDRIDSVVWKVLTIIVDVYVSVICVRPRSVASQESQSRNYVRMNTSLFMKSLCEGVHSVIVFLIFDMMLPEPIKGTRKCGSAVSQR